MLTILFLLLAMPWVLWVFFTCTMRLKQVRDAGQLTTAAKVFGYPALGVGLLLDFMVNITVACLIFLELPKETTVSVRLTRLSKLDAGWRSRWALSIRKALLDNIDPAGVHQG